MTALTALEVLDVAAVATLLRCSIKTVEERARAGDLPGLKYGDGWVFPAGALAQRLNELALEQSEFRKRPRATAAITKLSAKNEPRRPPRLPSAV